MRDGRDIVGNIEIRPYRGQEAGISVKSVAGEEHKIRWFCSQVFGSFPDMVFDLGPVNIVRPTKVIYQTNDTACRHSQNPHSLFRRRQRSSAVSWKWVRRGVLWPFLPKIF